MELRQLTYFLTLCETLHFTRAAEKLGIAQPTLSQQVRALEESVGLPLFDRLGKRIALTEAGAILKRHSEAIFRSLEGVNRELDDLRAFKAGTLVVGVLPSELECRLAPFFAGFYHAHPGILLRLLSAVDVERRVLDNEVDLGITQLPVHDDRLVSVSLYHEEYVVVVAPGHPLASRESIALADLADVPMVMYPVGFPGREVVDRRFRELGLQLDAVVETSSNPSLIEFVAAGVGAAILPHILLNAVHHPELRLIALNDGPPTREIGIVYQGHKYLGKAAQQFLRAARSLVEAPSA
jgi:DNA-binding transcriptional LysR family regulator